MRTVWKHEVPVDDQWHRHMVGRPVAVDTAQQAVALWSEVGEEGTSPLELRVYGTGQPIDDDDAVYLGTTVQRQYMDLVWHVYSRPAGDPA